MRRYQLGAHTKTDLKVHLIWIPKYRKRVLTGQVAVRVRDVLRQIALEHDAIAHLAPEALEFNRIAQEQGLKAALEWRDGPFRN